MFTYSNLSYQLIYFKVLFDCVSLAAALVVRYLEDKFGKLVDVQGLACRQTCPY